MKTNLLTRLIGFIFGLSASLIAVFTFVLGIALCTTIIGAVIGIPIAVYSIAFVFYGIHFAFTYLITGKYEIFKKGGFVPKYKNEDLRWKYTEFTVDNRYINN
jgi:hypothetical protein